MLPNTAARSGGGVSSQQAPKRVRGIRRSRRPVNNVVDTRVPHLPPTLTVDETAIALQVSREGVLAAIRAEQIPGYRLGRGYRIPTGKLLKVFRNVRASDPNVDAVGTQANPDQNT